MKRMRRWQGWFMAGIGLSLAAATGCQTNIAGMTLPSGHYLQHPPQYFIPSGPFPLPNELSHMEENYAQPVPGAPLPPAPVPAPVPAVPAPPPGPAQLPPPAGAPVVPPGM